MLTRTARYEQGSTHLLIQWQRSVYGRGSHSLLVHYTPRVGLSTSGAVLSGRPAEQAHQPMLAEIQPLMSNIFSGQYLLL